MKCRDIFCYNHDPSIHDCCGLLDWVGKCPNRKCYNRVAKHNKYQQWKIEHDKYYGRK